MATNGFLDVIRREGSDGKPATRPVGPALDPAGNFLFATGIECSYPTIDGGRTRRDPLAECGHYDHWLTDLSLVRDLGLRVLRYGLPYYRTHAGRYDWDFADRVMDRIHGPGLEPILDLLPFGVPDWLSDFQYPELPVRFAEYAGAVAERYPRVRFYTPVNEIYVAARMSGLDGAWNEQRRDGQSFVRAMVNLAAANVLGSRAIVARRRDAVLVQSETPEFTHATRLRPDPAITLGNALRFASPDLLYALPLDGTVLNRMTDHGLTRDESDWFMADASPAYQVMGDDYYGRNGKTVLPDGPRLVRADKPYWGRY